METKDGSLHAPGQEGISGYGNVEAEGSAGSNAGTLGKPRYCVLFTHTLKQWDVAETIMKSLPDGGGEVFYPSVELWWHGANRTRYRPLFPGYLFIRSVLEPAELHRIIRQDRGGIASFVRELGCGAGRMPPDAGLDDRSFTSLSREESEFFDMLLGFSYDSGLEERVKLAEKHGKLYYTKEEADAVRKKDADKTGALNELRQRRRNRITPKGTVQISFGYMDEGRNIVVMDGPLRGRENYITDYKVKDRKAFLSVSVAGHVTKAGLILLGKKVWFPDDGEALQLLPDDTEVDCRGLASIMAENGIK